MRWHSSLYKKAANLRNGPFYPTAIGLFIPAQGWPFLPDPNNGNVSLFKSIFGFGEQAVLWKHQLVLRKAEYYTNTNSKLISLFYRIRLNCLQNKYAIHIPLNTCGRGLKLMHVGPVLVSTNAIVGQDCVLHMNVGIVAGGNNGFAPQLGDNIVVGYGAVILGNTHIASGVAIGANAVVNKDVIEENIAVAGVPAKKISNNGRNTWANGADRR